MLESPRSRLTSAYLPLQSKAKEYNAHEEELKRQAEERHSQREECVPTALLCYR